MKQFIFDALLCIFLVSNVFSTGKKEVQFIENSPDSLRVAALIGPSGIGMAYLFANNPDLGNNIKVTFETAASVDALVPKLLQGDVDIGILPPNVAAKLYNLNSSSIVIGAIVGNSMIALVTKDTDVTLLSDLVGKTVSVVGQGATPEYVIRTLLAKEGISTNSVILDYSIPATEIGAALISGKIDYAFVPEPFATIAVINGSSAEKPVKRALYLRDVWVASGLGADFPMTVCVIRKEYADKYPDTVRKFLASYQNAINWTISHPSEAGTIVEASGLGLKAPVATKAIPYSNFTYISAIEGRLAIERLLSVFLDIAPESVGGKLPDEGFYFR